MSRTGSLENLQGTAIRERGRHGKHDIVLRLMHHCLCKTNIIYDRFMLNRRVRAEGEPFDQYLTALKELAKTCQYGPMQDDILRDRVLVGIRDDGLRKQLAEKKTFHSENALTRAARMNRRQRR